MAVRKADKNDHAGKAAKGAKAEAAKRPVKAAAKRAGAKAAEPEAAVRAGKSKVPAVAKAGKSPTSAASAKAAKAGKAPKAAAGKAGKAAKAPKAAAVKATKAAAAKASRGKASKAVAKVAKPAKAPSAKAPAKTKAAKAAARPSKAGADRKANGHASAERSIGGAKIFASPSDIRILVVDDEPEVLELLVPFLKKQGYSVSEAQDGDQALEKILTERPNIVVLDVMMPGLSGWEISRYVRERQELASVRIIMATGIGKDTNAATSPLYGADASIDKPFRLDALHQLVKDVVARIESGAL